MHKVRRDREKRRVGEGKHEQEKQDTGLQVCKKEAGQDMSPQV